jgi:hypothetical protein
MAKRAKKSSLAGAKMHSPRSRRTKTFKPKRRAEKERLKFAEGERKTIGVGVIRLPQ